MQTFTWTWRREPLSVHPTDSPQEDPRLIRIEDKLDKLFDGRVTQADLDKLSSEMKQSFVLKAVFDLWSQGLEKRVAEVETTHKPRWKGCFAFGGGGLGILSILNNWFHFIK